VAPFLGLAERAQVAGFQLTVASSFRSFERQLAIWNDKALGLRPVLDSAGVPLRVADLSEREKLFAILRWSALPGCSRHHWGTDLDVYDQAHMPQGYKLQLTVAETESNGPFALFHTWLARELAITASGFYRPYDQDRGGVAPEPWHLSYAPIAADFARQFSAADLCAQLLAVDIELKTCILANLDEIMTRFVVLNEV
jgi:LAS superfamily LD-carboxypeptidase LdcB